MVIKNRNRGGKTYLDRRVHKFALSIEVSTETAQKTEQSSVRKERGERLGVLHWKK